MYIIDKKIQGLHLKLLLDAGYNFLNKNIARELVNFIYYKISKLVSKILTPVRARWIIEKTEPDPFPGQLYLEFD